MTKMNGSGRRLLSVIKRYGLSVLSVAIALLATILLLHPTRRITPLFFPAILLSTWFGGTGPGLFAVLLSTLSINYFLLHSQRTLAIGLPDIPYLAAFLVSALLVSSWSAVRRRTEDALRRARDELEARVEERTAELSQSNEQLRTEIAERKRLRRLEAELAHTNRVSMLGELTASLAHEINQPIAASITSARACLRWLDRDQPEVRRAREAVMRIENDGRRAAEIINRVRAFYKKETPPERELVALNEVAREMIALLHSEAVRHSVVMRTDLAAELPTVRADRVQLQQVLMNLMLNAIEAMREAPGELTLKSEQSDGQILVSVSDTGVGLPPGKTDELFNAFFTTKPDGSGMGLAISRSIVESHGGRLWAAANPGRGATFHFTLPTQHEAHQ